MYDPINKSINTLTDSLMYAHNKYNETVISSVKISILFLITLAWNDVVQEIINNYYPNSKKKTLHSKIIYAILITFFVIIVQIYFFPLIEGKGNN